MTDTEKLAIIDSIVASAYLFDPKKEKKVLALQAMKQCKEALNKQIPKKYELFNGQCSCPNCKALFGSFTQLKNLIHWEMPYCKFCGQALDWSEI